MRGSFRKIAVLFVVLTLGTAPFARAAQFAEARIYIEYNASANDLGFHVFLDGEDWESLRILDPNGVKIFEVAAAGGYRGLGLTELFFEGAEPSLDEFPLADLLVRFPEGRYRFLGVAADGSRVSAAWSLTHNVPDGPAVSAEVIDGDVVIRWNEVTGPMQALPQKRVTIVGYQVIAGSFQVTLPATSRSVEIPDQYVASLPRGEHPFEVLAIEAGGHQSITEGTFTLE